MRARGLWPDRSRLRRTADRAEFAVAILLLAGAPLAAVQWAAVSGLQAERVQAGRHQVQVVLLREASAPADSAVTV